MSKKFEIGLFALNSSSGITMTKSKKRWKAEWNKIKKVAIASDKSKIDFIFSVQRWLGFKGKTDPAGLTYDSLNFCSALASITKNIKLFATVHVPILHPTYVARSLASIDQISRGRINLNIVCGWNKDEFQMFGLDKQTKIDRWLQGKEWLSSIKKILKNKKPFSFKGKYFQFKNASTSPKLYKNRSLNCISAAFSTTGRDFAIKNCSSLITMFSNLQALKNQNKILKKKAKKFNSNFKIYALVNITCAKTDMIAKKNYLNYFDKLSDQKAIENFIKKLSGGKKSIISKLQKDQKIKMAAGIGSYSIIGSPKSVINQINRIKKTGIDGIAISFLDYEKELNFFLKNIIKEI
jgi:dimethylsulfone monooxygenase